MRFEPVTDDSALRSLQNLAPDPKNYPTCQHQREHVVEPCYTEYELTKHTEQTSYNKYDPCSKFVNQGASDEGNNDVWERVD
jgi:hypothetical protein